MRREYLSGGAVLSMAGCSHAGRVRQANEDSFVVDEMAGIAIVADGLGGENAGDVASAVTVNVIRNAISMRMRAILGQYINTVELSDGDLKLVLRAAMIDAHAEVLARSSRDVALRGMASTVVVLLVHGGNAVLGWVGDSSAFMIRQASVLRRLTTSHNIANELATNGGGGGAVHPSRRALTRVVGGSEELFSPDVMSCVVQSGDVFLLCSDGLTDMIDEAQIHAALTSDASLDSLCQDLVDMANAAGGEDNVTAVLIRVDEAPVALSAGAEIEARDGVARKASSRVAAVEKLHISRFALTSGLSFVAGAILGAGGVAHFYHSDSAKPLRAEIQIPGAPGQGSSAGKAHESKGLEDKALQNEGLRNNNARSKKSSDNDGEDGVRVAPHSLIQQSDKVNPVRAEENRASSAPGAALAAASVAAPADAPTSASMPSLQITGQPVTSGQSALTLPASTPAFFSGGDGRDVAPSGSSTSASVQDKAAHPEIIHHAKRKARHRPVAPSVTSTSTEGGAP